MKLYEWLFEFPGHKINPVFLFYILPVLLLGSLVAVLIWR